MCHCAIALQGRLRGAALAYCRASAQGAQPFSAGTTHRTVSRCMHPCLPCAQVAPMEKTPAWGGPEAAKDAGGRTGTGADCGIQLWGGVAGLYIVCSCRALRALHAPAPPCHSPVCPALLMQPGVGSRPEAVLADMHWHAQAPHALLAACQLILACAA